MQSAALFLLTVLTLIAAAYTHYRLPFHSAGTKQLWLTRLLLIAVGLAFGWVVSRRYQAGGIAEAAIFLSAFGVVHVPAAFILFIKRRRKEWR